jgi:hypothetical protein
MIKTSVEKLAKEIGYDIGISDDITQATLLNGFCEGLSTSIQPPTLGAQICALVRHLNPKSEHILMEIVEFIKLK